MPTLPRSPDDEAPLDAGSVDRLLTGLGMDMVLVGGQALAFWMDRFRLVPDAPLITSDGDVMGSAERAKELARALGVRCVLPRASARTALVAQLRIPADGGRERNVDVLHQLYTVGGPAKSMAFTRRVVAGSVTVEWKPGCHIRVMDPFDVLESRVQNAAGLLDQKGPHVLTQVRWAVEVAREALLRLAAKDRGLEGRLGRRLQALYTLAHSLPGKALLREHGIELLKAVEVDKLGQAAPAHRPQLERIAAALGKRGQRA